MAENNEYRSDVFSMLLEDKRNALEVYNALNGTSYDDPDAVTVVTLKKGISLSMRNDAAFIVDMNLNIYEHQSTYNPNMPLRSLFYLEEILKPLFKNVDLLRRKRIMIPTPRFVVFYNGVEKRPAVETLKLSDSFEPHIENPELELICTVYNINPGFNDEFLGKCHVLSDYMKLVLKVIEYKEQEDEEAVSHAIDYCMEHGILEGFLSDKRDEVEKNMTLDMTWEHREKLIRQDERAEGRSEGRIEGRIDSIAKFLSKGKTDEEAKELLDATDEEISKAKELLLASV